MIIAHAGGLQTSKKGPPTESTLPHRAVHHALLTGRPEVCKPGAGLLFTWQKRAATLFDPLITELQGKDGSVSQRPEVLEHGLQFETDRFSLLAGNVGRVHAGWCSRPLAQKSAPPFEKC